MKFLKYMMFLSVFALFGNVVSSEALLEDQALQEMSATFLQCGTNAACEVAKNVVEVVPSVWEPARNNALQVCANVLAGLKNAGCTVVKIAPGVMGYMLGELNEATGFLRRAPALTIAGSVLISYGGYKAYYGLKDWWNAPVKNQNRR